jgi:hypothetical protein
MGKHAIIGLIVATGLLVLWGIAGSFGQAGASTAPADGMASIADCGGCR